MLERTHELRERGETSALETTLDARSYVPLLRDAQEAGYLVHVLYVWLSSVELARSSVAVRVQQGGHNVPVRDIERRYWRGLRNLFALYQTLADSWVLCDNSGEELTVVARSSTATEPTVYEPGLFDRIRHAAEQKHNQR